MLKINPTFEQMINGRNIKLKVMMAKWLLISTIAVSLFALSGPAGLSVLQPQKAQTELVSPNVAKPCCRAVAYRIQTVNAYAKFIYGTNLLYTRHLLAYGRLSKVKFDQLLRKTICLKICHKLHRLKIIPQDTGEDLRDCFIA